MALRPGLSARQTQRLGLTPGLRQGMSVLQLSTPDLLVELTRMAEENPLILVDRPSRFGGAAVGHLAAPETLAQSLRRQIGLMALDRPVALLAQFLTGDLTEDGYLGSTPEDLADGLGLPLDQINTAIAALQACEPSGVGARDLADCLRIQMIDRGVPAQVAEAVCRHLDLVAAGRWREAQRASGLPRARIEDLAALVRTLNPRPGSGFADPPAPLIPEVMVERDGQDGLTVSLNNGALPDVRLDRVLLQQIERGSALSQSHRAPAEDLVRALRFRSATLRRVTRALVAHQHRFFADPPGEIAPLTRAELATTLGLHPSTVGRAIAGKALAFGGAVFPLSHFLSSALGAGDGGQISANAVKSRIRRMIEQETPDAPLSDVEIADALMREGVDIARRTIAKYRGCMKIPSSFERGRLKAARRTRPGSPGRGTPDQP